MEKISNDSVGGGVYHNPVQRGFFPDPSVVRVGEDYYMVNSSFQYFPAIPISHSKDMINWHLIGHAIVDSSYLDLADIPDSHGIWAPDIYFEDGRFYIIATLRLNGDGKRGNNVLRRQLLVSADRPEGPYCKPIWLEEDNIDPSLFRDDDGKLYMIIAAGVRAVHLSDDGSKIIGPAVTLWPGTGERCPEGPHLLKKDGWYYAVLAEGGTGYGHGINVARSRTMFGTYEPSPYNPVLRQTDPDASLQRAGHGKPIQAQDGSWWMFYLCGRRNGGNYTTIGRESALDPIEFTEDGWFTVNGGKGPSTAQAVPKLLMYPFPVKSRWDFDEEKLDLEWEFVRNPDTGSFSVTERPGWLRIYTRDGQLNERRAKNTLLHREQELTYQAETKLSFMPSKDGEQAGLTCYYSTATYVRFSLCWEGGRKLQLVINRNHGEELKAELSQIRECDVYLRVEVEGLRRTFSYSYDGVEYHTVGVLENCIFLCDEGVPDDPKRHTGTLVGIYANNGGCGSRIPADFDYFSYQD
jgi:xylan 1,4-beta-xylosidase